MSCTSMAALELRFRSAAGDVLALLSLYHGLFGLLLALIAGRRNQLNLRARRLRRSSGTRSSGANLYHRLPLDLLGTTQVDNIPLSRLATVTGVYGISFEIALVNTAVAAAFLVPTPGANCLDWRHWAAAIGCTLES